MKARVFSRQMMSAVLVGLLVTGVGTAMARGQRGQGDQDGSRRGAGIERLTRHLDLNEEQVAAITEIQTKGRAANLELRKEMMRLQNEKRGEMLKDEPSEKKVVDLTKRIGDLKTTMQTNRASNRLAVRKLLTPAQRDQMLLMGEHRGGGRGGRGGRGGEQCGGEQCGGGQCDGSGGRGSRGHQGQGRGGV